MNSRFSALLLAGGKSSRMQRDKALIEVGGEPLWRRQLRILRALRPNELFIAGPLHDKGCITIADAQPESGPLGGVVAALRRCSSPLLLVLAVDLPRMTSDYLRALLEASAENVGVVPHRQPLCAVYPVASLRLAERYLASGNYSMQRFASEGLVSQRPIDPTDEHLFLNMNRPEDLLALTHA